MELTVQNVYGLLLRSKLLSIDEAKAMFARWNDECQGGEKTEGPPPMKKGAGGEKAEGPPPMKGAAADLARFAAWMVANKYVTEYQARLLAGGHAEGFFLGGYMVLDRLGKGRMAGVYKARHPTGQVVAIKVLPPSKARDPMLLGRFQREAKLALRLDHPNIVRGFQVGHEGDLHFLVMEYLDGETLEDALTRRGKLPPDEAVRLVHQALQGLQHIHEQGLVHRDLKPSNLMLIPTPDGPAVKILDIGLGRMMDEGLDPADPGLTGEGVLLGTPDYMAPEQARDARAIDIRADIYSLGCVLYHLLAGQPPFPDTNIISQMIRHASEPPRPVASLSPGVPDGLQQILNWMMAKAPEGRYPTPARAADALSVFLAAGAADSSHDDGPGMKPFLEWLAQEKKKAPPSGHAIPTAAPVKPSSGHTIPTAPPAPPAKPASGHAIPTAAPVKPASGHTIPTAAPVKPASGHTIPTAAPPKPAPAAPPPPKPGKPERRPRKEKAPPSPPPPSPPAGPEAFDVELLPPPEPAVLPGGLTRRDLAFFFAGAGAAAAAYLIGWGVASLLRRRTPPDPDEGK